MKILRPLKATLVIVIGLSMVTMGLLAGCGAPSTRAKIEASEASQAAYTYLSQQANNQAALDAMNAENQRARDYYAFLVTSGQLSFKAAAEMMFTQNASADLRIPASILVGIGMSVIFVAMWRFLRKKARE